VRLQIAGGTVTGSAHQHKLNVKNNQDAYAWQFGYGAETVCAVVSDGCSSSKHSEVGAHIVAKRIPGFVLSRTREFAMSDHVAECAWEHIRWRIIECITGTMLPLKDYYLCTILGVLVSLDHLTIFSIGDGAAYLNGDEVKLPEYPNNAPAYLAYELIQDSIKNPQPELYKFKIHAQIPVGEFETCLIGSDGVKDLATVMDISEFWTEDRYFQNPDQVRRKLAVINKRKGARLGPLPDDTTLVVVRRYYEG
jgi:serine/threonine protein phosphatase PrpC